MLHLQHEGGRIELRGGSLRQADECMHYSASISGNAPIELKVNHADSSKLIGACADGRSVTVNISPHDKQQEPLNAAVLVDRSGSMGADCAQYSENPESQHEAVVRGLHEFLPSVIDGDHLSLWEFDTECDRVGHTKKPSEFSNLLGRLGGPRGGTSIGSALRKVMATEEGNDVLLITDGQSYDLNVHELAKAGHRIFVVLVGKGSLEALVGHLAVLSGGDIHFSFGEDVGQAITLAYRGCVKNVLKMSVAS